MKSCGRDDDDYFPVNFDNEHYDLKRFLREHPGGVNTISNYRGKCIKQAMLKIGHSTSAYHMLNDLKASGDVKDVNLTGQVSENGRIITEDDDRRDAAEIKFLEELECRIDWSKPILGQLDAIAPHYEQWVNAAVYRRGRLFANPVMEAFTYTPWYLVPVVWLPIILYLGVTQYLEYVHCEDHCKEVVTLSRIQFICHIAQGLLIWTVVEYSLHRWLFHLNPGSSVAMIKFHFALHGIHHKTPFDKYRLVFPPLPAIFIARCLYFVSRMVVSFPTVKIIGALTGYVIYDMIHYYVHHGSPRDGTYLYAMKRYHSNHHFINHNKAFGISCKIWDYMFKTFVKVRKLGFSMHW